MCSITPDSAWLLRRSWQAKSKQSLALQYACHGDVHDIQAVIMQTTQVTEKRSRLNCIKKPLARTGAA